MISVGSVVQVHPDPPAKKSDICTSFAKRKIKRFGIGLKDEGL